MRDKKGFTLVELLVVIGIIAVLIAMLLPALNRAREAARRVACMSNQRQLLLANAMYENDWGVFVPETNRYATYSEAITADRNWCWMLRRYLGIQDENTQTKIFVCPDDPYNISRSYRINDTQSQNPASAVSANFVIRFGPSHQKPKRVVGLDHTILFVCVQLNYPGFNPDIWSNSNSDWYASQILSNPPWVTSDYYSYPHSHGKNDRMVCGFLDGHVAQVLFPLKENEAKLTWDLPN